MAEKEYFIDDRVIIPEKIKNMTREERRAEIARLEAAAAEEKNESLNSMRDKEDRKGHLRWKISYNPHADGMTGETREMQENCTPAK